MSKLVGEGIAHYRLLREDTSKVKCIGLTMWGTVNETTRIELKRATIVNESTIFRKCISNFFGRNIHNNQLYDKSLMMLKKLMKQLKRIIHIVFYLIMVN